MTNRHIPREVLEEFPLVPNLTVLSQLSPKYLLIIYPKCCTHTRLTAECPQNCYSVLYFLDIHNMYQCRQALDPLFYVSESFVKTSILLPFERFDLDDFMQPDPEDYFKRPCFVTKIEQYYSKMAQLARQTTCNCFFHEKYKVMGPKYCGIYESFDEAHHCLNNLGCSKECVRCHTIEYRLLREITLFAMLSHTLDPDFGSVKSLQSICVGNIQSNSELLNASAQKLPAALKSKVFPSHPFWFRQFQ